MFRRLDNEIKRVKNTLKMTRPSHFWPFFAMTEQVKILTQLSLLILLWGASLGSSASVVSPTLKIFDAHLHYGGEDADTFTPQEILDIFERNHVTHALISSTPNSGTEALYRAAPQKIIPFLGIYESLREKGRWGDNPDVLQRVEEGLATGIYRGIGEFHLFKADRKSPVLKRIVEIAQHEGLILQVHSDAEIIDEIFSIAPNVTVLWAHLGTDPRPEFLAQMLTRYPQGLYIDTTVRDAEFVDAKGVIKPEWSALFTRYASRFLVGVDTFSVNRWHHFDQVIAQIRAWLQQLPPEVAQQLAYDNAAQLFLKPPVSANGGTYE